MRLVCLGAVLFTACCMAHGGGAGPTPTPGPPPPTGQCAKDQPCNQQELAWCPSDTPRPLALKDVLASGAAHNQQTVAITGPLRQGVTRCTKMACGPDRPCCNRCSANLVLSEGAAQSPLGGGDAVQLLGDGLACTGDDTGVCCPFQADGKAVTAVGTLSVTGDAQNGFVFELQGAHLCAYRVE